MATQISNLLIEKLPPGYKESLYARLEPVSLPIGTMLYEPDATPDYVHFLTSGMISIVTHMADGSSAEVVSVGSEGLVESFHLLSASIVHTVPTCGFVQISGTAMRMKFTEMRKEFLVGEPLRNLVLGFVQYQGFLLGQLAACNRLHEVEKRLARCLLMVQDRVRSDLLPLTQELLSTMLGTQRSSVTLAASHLQRGGSIEYHRGIVHILRRDLLEDAACECYRVARGLFADLYQ